MNMDNATKNLTKRGFEVRSFKTRTEAADYIVENVKDTTVGIGGSVTIDELDVYDRLCETNEVFWQSRQDPATALANAKTAAIYLTSANAVAETGEIINIDGRGNRVAATLYDREVVYIIVGRNKFAATFDKAVWRARNIASPKNAVRLNKNTPCAVKGDRCYDCNKPERICNALVVLWGKPSGVGRVEVLIVDESLGY